LKLGVLYCQQQQYHLAQNMLERASRLDPADEDLLTLVEAGRNIIATHGYASSKLFPLFSAYIGNSNHIDELIKGFVTHLSISPNLNDIMAIIEKGDFPRNNLENLLLLFQDYKALFPEYSDIYYILGILYRKLGHIKDAEQCLTESIRLNPNYVKARMNLFSLLKEQGKLQEAIEQGYALEGFNLLYPDLYSGLADICLGLNRFSEAEQFAKKAVAINPGYQRAIQLLKIIHERQGSG
jgi:tetratricopeptide (TPR) repeat protein